MPLFRPDQEDIYERHIRARPFTGPQGDIVHPDMREDPTPIVPFSATNITLCRMLFLQRLDFVCATSEIMDLPCNSRSDRECAWLPESKSVKYPPPRHIRYHLNLLRHIRQFRKNSASA